MGKGEGSGENRYPSKGGDEENTREEPEQEREGREVGSQLWPSQGQQVREREREEKEGRSDAGQPERREEESREGKRKKGKTNSVREGGKEGRAGSLPFPSLLFLPTCNGDVLVGPVTDGIYHSILAGIWRAG